MPELEGNNALNSRIEFGILADLRHSIRRFLAFGDQNAQKSGLTPQQYQALLGIKAGYVGRESISVGELAEHLLIKHHSAVELSGRLEAAKFITRTQDPKDRRVVLLSITPAAERVLGELSRGNLHELRLAVPVFSALVAMLDRDWLPRRQREVLAKMRELAQSIATALSGLDESQNKAAETNVVKFVSHESIDEAGTQPAGFERTKPAKEATTGSWAQGQERAKAPALAAFSKAFSSW
jgi:DNA-binding MarR family transcriptional regulator